MQAVKMDNIIPRYYAIIRPYSRFIVFVCNYTSNRIKRLKKQIKRE